MKIILEDMLCWISLMKIILEDMLCWISLMKIILEDMLMFSVNWIIILGFYHLIQQVQGSIVSDVSAL